jgi:lipoic acid synthetase
MSDKTKQEKAAKKFACIPIHKAIPTTRGPKPSWLRVKWFDSVQSAQVKKILKTTGLSTVCQEASCPNRGECFHLGTATFMILGRICTRQCTFCDVEYGEPSPIDKNEPQQLAIAVEKLNLKYVVMTSVTRDDLLDGGAAHFSACISAIRQRTPHVRIEILTPDFQHCLDQAIEILGKNLPDVFNHNIETIPRLYSTVRPKANFKKSLQLLNEFKLRFEHIPTKSGLMVGLGETEKELIETLKALHEHGVERLTIGQYLQPTRYHLSVVRYVTPAEFKRYKDIAKSLGFTHVMSGPLVRSSYHAEHQGGDN